MGSQDGPQRKKRNKGVIDEDGKHSIQIVRYYCLQINSHFYFCCRHRNPMRDWVLNYCVPVGCVGVSGEKTLL